MKKILIVGDSHGDHIDLRCRDALLEFKKDFKPDVKVHLGDAYDFRGLRRGASVEERAESGKLDIDMGNGFLRDYFDTRKGKNIFLWGNHDQRIVGAMESSNGQTRDYASDVWENMIKFLKSRKVENPECYYDSRFGIVETGPFRFMHGYSSAENAAKDHCRWAGKLPCVISGHNHYRSYWRDVAYDRKESYSVSCMCDIDPEYASKNKRKLRHSKGWLYGWYDGEDYELYPVEEKNGKYITTTQIKAF